MMLSDAVREYPDATWLLGYRGTIMRFNNYFRIREWLRFERTFIGDMRGLDAWNK